MDFQLHIVVPKTWKTSYQQNTDTQFFISEFIPLSLLLYKTICTLLDVIVMAQSICFMDWLVVCRFTVEPKVGLGL